MSMNREDKALLGMGKQVVRMINDLRKTSGRDAGYAIQKVSFPGGHVYLMIANDKALVDRMERAVESGYAVENAIPPSTVN